MTVPELPDEKELLLRVANGDETAFYSLFQHWHPRLSAFLFKLTESIPITQELVQDTFLKIWINRQALKEVRDFKNYLFVIARNKAFNELRNIATRWHHHQQWQKQQPEWDISTNDSEAHHLLIAEAVQKLPPKQQQAWILTREEGLTYQQAADRLNVSRETIKTNLQQANAFITRYVKGRIDGLITLAILSKDLFL